MSRCAADDVRMTSFNAVLSVADVYKEELTTRDRYWSGDVANNRATTSKFANR